MISVRRSRLSSWVTDLLASGRIAFSRDEAMSALGLGRRPFLDAAERLQKQNHLVSPRHGFYVIVPPQFHAWGAPPPTWYIDQLMRFEAHDYYVGLLKAAELHGATHHAVMAFQVITDKRLPDLRIGRSAITFHYRKNIGALADGILDHKTETGQMRVSSPELTALDVLRYARAAAGINNIATVLNDLAERLNPQRLASLAHFFERAAVQRLGYLLDTLGHAERTQRLHDELAAKPLHWVELDPLEAKASVFTNAPVERNKRWHVAVRSEPDMDI